MVNDLRKRRDGTHEETFGDGWRAEYSQAPDTDLPVCSGDEPSKAVGMITDRDIAMCAMFHPKPLRELPVSDAMARKLRVCRQTDSVEDAESIMRDAQVRRLPVVDSDERIVGMISLADLAREATRECAPGASKEITETQVGDTLAAICEMPTRRLAAA
jgi:predicted transcriptional regulator